MHSLPLRVIAIAQIGGALMGIGLMYTMAIPRIGMSQPFMVVFAGFLGICLVGGVELWRGLDRGLWLSVLAQLPQVLEFGSAAAPSRMYAGPELVWGIGETADAFRLGFGAGIQLHAPTPAAYVGFNIAAIAALSYLLVFATRTSRPPAGALASADAPAV